MPDLATGRTILLTGGTGFLGSNLLAVFLEAGFKVLALKRSSSNTTRVATFSDRVVWYESGACLLDDIFRDHCIDAIIHCATNYGRGDQEPRSILEANLFLPLALLELGSKNGVPCFINTDTLLDKKVSYYSLSKSQFRDWLRLYAERMTCINVALEHFYGPHDDRTKFVSFIIDALLTGESRIALTAGAQKRDFIHIDDVRQAFMSILDHSATLGKGYFSFEIGSGHLVSIREFVTKVRTLVGADATQLDFGALPYRDGEVMESSVDDRSIMALGWRPVVSLEDGLRRTIEAEREGR